MGGMLLEQPLDAGGVGAGGATLVCLLKWGAAYTGDGCIPANTVTFGLAVHQLVGLSILPLSLCHSAVIPLL